MKISKIIAPGETINIRVRMMFGDFDISRRFPIREVARDDGDSAFAEKYTATDEGLSFSVPYSDLFTDDPLTQRTVYVTASNASGESASSSVTISRANLHVNSLGNWDDLYDASGLDHLTVERTYDRVDDLSPRNIPSVLRYGIQWQLVVRSTTEEPGFGCSDWEPISGHETTMKIHSSLGDLMAVGENNEITCEVFYGEQNVTALADQWVIERNSGDSVEDTVWNASAKARSFDGVIVLAYTTDASTNDLGPGMTTSFNIKAKKGGVVIAEGLLEI